MKIELRYFGSKILRYGSKKRQESSALRSIKSVSVIVHEPTEGDKFIRDEENVTCAGSEDSVKRAVAKCMEWLHAKYSKEYPSSVSDFLEEHGFYIY